MDMALAPDDTDAWAAMLRSDIDAFNRAAGQHDFSVRIDLSESDLSGLDLRNAEIDRCDLTNADLSECKVDVLRLARARLKGTRLEGITHEGSPERLLQIQLLWQNPEEWNKYRETHRPELMILADFSGADLGVADLSGMSFGGARFEDAILSRCSLNNANFAEALLARAKIQNNEALAVNFDDADLSHALLDGSSLSYAKLNRAVGHFASFENAHFVGGEAVGFQASNVCFDGIRAEGLLLFESILSGSTFRNATLQETHFDGADLTDTNFGNATLTDCRFIKADVSGADFRGCHGLDLTGASHVDMAVLS